jgi:hypothetical protein
MYGVITAGCLSRKWEESLRTHGEVMVNDGRTQATHLLMGLAAIVNRRPLLWTIGLMVPTYLLAFMLAFAALAFEPLRIGSVLPVLILCAAALMVMSYHWFFSRYQRASRLAQAIQFFAGLLPVIGGFMVFAIMRSLAGEL